MQKALKMKILIGILAALSALGVLVAHELRVNRRIADAASKLAAERDKAKQIDQDDKAAIQKIRERNAQKAASTANQK
jgi:hypothetical protein